MLAEIDKLEIRYAAPKPSEPRPEASQPGADERELRMWLSGLVQGSPVAIDPNPTPVLSLLNEGLTRDDIERGIANAFEKGDFRPRFWSQLVGWARRAAKDRLAQAPKRAGGSAPAATASPPPDPARQRERYKESARRFFDRHLVWLDNAGPEPGRRGCEIPPDILVEAAAEYGKLWPISPGETFTYALTEPEQRHLAERWLEGGHWPPRLDSKPGDQWCRVPQAVFEEVFRTHAGLLAAWKPKNLPPGWTRERAAEVVAEMDAAKLAEAARRIEEGAIQC